MWRELSAADMLTAYERGTVLHPVDRALLILFLASTQHRPGDLACLSLGERDRALLIIRAATLGSRLDAIAACPACAAVVEFLLNTGDLLATSTPAACPRAAVTADGITVQMRSPDSRDIARAARCADAAAAEACLLDACVITAERDGQPVAPGELPPATRAAVADTIVAAEPLSEVSLALSCPACGTGWDLLLDAASLFWAEISHSARRLIEDVAVLARAYGWSEQAILAMSPVRRQWYLSGVG